MFRSITALFIATAALAQAQGTVMDAEGKPFTLRDPSRIVSLGGPVTEIIYALGERRRLIAVDASTTRLPPPSWRK